MFYIIQTIVVTIMFYSLTKNHYIGPLHSCLMAKICNHTGIEICGMEKGNRDTRSFLDDCDMFEYNCDYKKAYSQVNDELCRENRIETSTENLTTTISDVGESTSVNYSSQTTTLETHTTSGVTSQQTTTTETQIVATPTESLNSVSGNTDGKCTCIPTSESIGPSNSRTELSSTKTTIDKTSETTLNFTETTTTARTSESAHVTESIERSTYANGSKIPIATECTRSKQNNTFITTSKEQTTDMVTKSTRIIDKTTDTVISDITERCTCMDTEMPTSTPHSKTHSTKTSINLETEGSTTLPKTITNQINETITTSTQLESKIITMTTQPMTPGSETRHDKCTCMDFQTNPVTSTTESTITLSQSLTTTTSTTTSTSTPTSTTSTTTSTSTPTSTTTTSTPTSTTTSTPTSTTISTPISTTTLSTTDVDTTFKRNSCDKYPKYCDRPHTWETTARGETRDFFQILKKRFGNRVKILKDTTHWPRRMTKLVNNENEAFQFGSHNET